MECIASNKEEIKTERLDKLLELCMIALEHSQRVESKAGSAREKLFGESEAEGKSENVMPDSYVSRIADYLQDITNNLKGIENFFDSL